MFLFSFLTDNQQKITVYSDLRQKFKFCIHLDTQNILSVTTVQLLRNFIIIMPLQKSLGTKKAPPKAGLSNLYFRKWLFAVHPGFFS